jgi:hypothetical protein
MPQRQQQCGAGLDQRRAEAPGPQRPAPAVAAVEGGGIAPAQRLHHAADAGGAVGRGQQRSSAGVQA